MVLLYASGLCTLCLTNKKLRRKKKEKTKKKNTNVKFFPKRARRSGGVSL